MFIDTELLDYIRYLMHSDEFIRMKPEAQLLYLYLLLDAPGGSNRPEAISLMLFGCDPNYDDPMSALQILIDKDFIEIDTED